MFSTKVLIRAFEPILKLALEEDLGEHGDVTTRAICGEGRVVRASLLSKEAGILCGFPLLEHVLLGENASNKIFIHVTEGGWMEKGQCVAEVEMNEIAFLKYERILLNLIQRLSGIATLTASFVKRLEGTNIRMLDTRKTLPAYRILDKYAVFTGGGSNHRMGLYDMFMIKDNHIKVAGGVKEAIQRVQQFKTSQKLFLPVEVECKEVAQVREALECSVDIIMLDNMELDDIGESLAVIKRRVKVEISGGVTLESLEELKNFSVDFISAGQLTHSPKALDLSFKIKENSPQP